MTRGGVVSLGSDSSGEWWCWRTSEKFEVTGSR